MSVELPIELTAAQAHSAAIDDVNRWRGHCVECFARLERSMGEALEVIAGVSPSAKRMPHTFGDKHKALRALSSPQLPQRLLKAFRDAEELLDQRNRIVHASGKVWVDGSGSWAWAYRFNPTGKAEDAGMYEQSTAERFEVELAIASRSLCDRLREFSKKLNVNRT